MKVKSSIKNMNDAEYYDKHSVLKEIIEDPLEMSLNAELRASIISGKRKSKLKNISVKLDPLQIRAIKKNRNYESCSISDPDKTLAVSAY